MSIGLSKHLAVGNFTLPPVPEWASCKRKTPSTKYRDQFCAYSQLSSSTDGDSGSPFICEKNGFAMIHGIHRGKWHPADKKKTVLEGYVFKHMEFIKKYMKQFPAPCC